MEEEEEEKDLKLFILKMKLLLIKITFLPHKTPQEYELKNEQFNYLLNFYRSKSIILALR